MPAVFIAMGLSAIVLRRDLGASAYLAWFAAAALFVPVGFVTGPRLIGIDRQRGEIARAGSAVPLVRDLVVFALQYAVAVADGTHLGAHDALFVAGRGVSGASAGYFLGWAILLLLRYRSAGPAAI